MAPATSQIWPLTINLGHGLDKINLFCLTAVLVAAFPMAAQEVVQEELLAPAKGEIAGITLVTDEDGTTRVVGSDNFPSPNADAKAELRRQAVNEQIAKRVRSGKTHQVA